MDRFESMGVLLAVVETGSLSVAGPGRLPLKLRAFLDFAVPALRERLGARA